MMFQFLLKEQQMINLTNARNQQSNKELGHENTKELDRYIRQDKILFSFHLFESLNYGQLLINTV